MLWVLICIELLCFIFVFSWFSSFIDVLMFFSFGMFWIFIGFFASRVAKRIGRVVFLVLEIVILFWSFVGF